MEGKMKEMKAYSAQYKPPGSNANAKSGKGVYSHNKNPLMAPARGSSLRTGGSDGQSKMVNEMKNQQAQAENMRGQGA